MTTTKVFWGSPEDPAPGRIREIRVSTLHFLLLVAVCAGLIAAASGALLMARQAFSERAVYQSENERLHDENQAQQFHIQRFADKVGQLSVQVEKLQNYYTRLKLLAQTDLQAPEEKRVAVGGPQPHETDMDVYLEKDVQKQIRRMHWELEELQMEAQLQEQTAHRIENFFDSQQSLLAATPTIWPVSGWLSSSFGYRISPFTGTLQMHEGIDIGASTGTPVKATADGIVVFAGWKGEYGQTVIIDHGYGYKTRYGHLDGYNVFDGDRIKRGDVLGTVGDTGRSTGPHLHYEVRLRGVPVNPKPYFLD